MDPILLQSPTSAKPPGVGCPFGGAAYESLLRDSIDRFLGQIRSESRDFSGFQSVFFRLLQSRADPPLEIVWFYSAVRYHESFSTEEGVLGRVSAIRDFLQLLAACSASCDGLKSIALLAPVAYELYQIIVELGDSCGGFSSKEVKKLKKEIYHLAEGVLSYIGICSGRSCDGKDASVGLLPCFVDLVRIWTAQRGDCGDALRKFFPLVNDEVRNALAKEGCQIRYLAGVVIAEAFLLMLRLKLQKAGDLRPELQKELKTWAVASITAFRNRDFFEILMILLLNQNLSCNLVSGKDEAFLRDILLDSLILVDYSFLYPGKEVEHSYDGVKRLSMLRLLVIHDAIQTAREKGDQGKAIAYTDAFSRSSLPSLLVKLVNNQIGAEKLSGANSATPQALLKCLLNLEEHGLKVLEFDMSKLQSRLPLDESKASTAGRNSMTDGEKEDNDVFFFDNKGLVAEDGPDDQEMELMDNVFLSAARTMKLTPSNGKKRRGSKGSEGKTPVKFVKYKLLGSSVKDTLIPKADDMSGESDVENPPSDDEMEDTDQ